MSRVLNRDAVKNWLSGQRAAAARIEVERAFFLLSLTPERSRQIYLELYRYGAKEPPRTPSPVLLAIRYALSRFEAGHRK